MTIVYATTLKNTRMTAVVTALDSGGPGYLEIGTAGMAVVLATVDFESTCGTVSGGVLTFSGTPLSATAAASGTAAAAEAFDGAGSVIVSGLTVGVSGADINLSSTAIVDAEPVTITSAAITHG